ncbi:MAG: PA2779 family protein [Pseudomonadales bacterium]|nr:PA2779 family protein [Pseudomonadales bacterium]
MTSSIVKKLLVSVFSLTLLFSGLYGTVANAAMVSTAQVQHEYDKQTLISALQKTEVQEKLLSLGVNAADVEQRVQYLTPDELVQINQHMDEIEAGSGIVGLVVLVFVVLVVTDLLGATDIFPFIQPVQ